MKGNAADNTRRAFTLTELLTVIGLVVLLVSLLLPVLARMRATAAATTCLSNMRQMGTAWQMYLCENRGRLIDFIWYTPTTPDVAWNGYWPGVMDKYGVKDKALLCPAAREPAPSDARGGYGSAEHAWTGKYETNGCAVRLNDKTYRESSYGYNRYLTSGNGFGGPGDVTYLVAVTTVSNVPAFMDCAYADARPVNGTEERPEKPPPNLRGNVAPGDPEHWKFMIARHGRGINVYMADGSATWVRLEDLYMLAWKTNWIRYRLTLPVN